MTVKQEHCVALTEKHVERTAAENSSSHSLFVTEAYWMFKDRDEAQERTHRICNDKKIL